MTSLAERIDATTVEELRTRGSQKWADAGGSLGAWIAEMDFGVAPEIADALAMVTTQGLYGYAPTTLWQELSEATADFVHEQTGWQPEPSQVACVSDVIHGLDLVIEHFSAPGSAVVLPTPAYMPFLDVPGAHGREVRQVPLSQTSAGWRIDLDALDHALDGAGVLLWVNPHNPIGKVYSLEEIEAVVDVVARHPGVRVYADEIHSPIMFGGEHTPYASVNDESAMQAITAVAASKMWNLAGLKCAQLILTNPEDQTRWKRSARRASVQPSTPGMVASVAAYRHGGPWRSEILDYLDGNRRLLGEFVAERMPQVKVRLPDATYLAFLDCNALPLDDVSPHAYFKRNADVLYTDGGLCGEAGRGFIRMNFATPRPILTRMLEQTAAAVERLQPGA